MSSFEVLHQSSNSGARLGKFRTPEGEVNTPAFFPVGTQATVKTLSSLDLKECGIQGILCNIYHLYLRPGIETIEALGGLHRFMGFDRPIITDSGGYQIFSLASLKKVKPEGVEFNSHLDGSKHLLSPGDVVRMQFRVSSSAVVCLDECLKFPVSLAYARESLNLTTHWAALSMQAFKEASQEFARKPVFLGVIQGSTYPELRKKAIDDLIGLGFRDFAFGGLSVGEPANLRYNIASLIVENLPPSSLRYIMGIGKPQDILEAVERGIDLCDCVIPTRLGRTGTAFTDRGRIVVRNALHAQEDQPIDRGCGCFVCKNFSRAYLRHLINSKEILGSRLISYHNVWWFARFLEKIRTAVSQDRFPEFKKDFLDNYNDKGGIE